MALTTANKLKLYNGALLILEENKLSALTDAIESRYVLDEIYDDGGVDWCLEQGLWNFAMRTVKLEYSPTLSPNAFGYTYTFELPSDHIRIAAISSEERFSNPLLEYFIQQEYIFCDLEEIYLRFISNGSSYGHDYSVWPETFKDLVKTYFAARGCKRITSSDSLLDRLQGTDGKGGLLRTKKNDALSKDAMQGATQFMPQGSWVGSRAAGRSLAYDRGNRSRLIG
jgi:hypothetical protein